jgi:hypothetical protein
MHKVAPFDGRVDLDHCLNARQDGSNFRIRRTGGSAGLGNIRTCPCPMSTLIVPVTEP